MPIFMTQGRYTTSAIRGMVSAPEDRSRAVEALVTASGGRMINYYMTFGDYDFVVISVGPSEKAMASALVAAAAGGGVTGLKTTLLISPTEMKEAFEEAGNIANSFKSAGGVLSS